MRFFFTLIIVLLTFHSLSAQERTISGRLTSTEDGSPLPGVNITIKGTSTGTVTDTDGYYSINVPIGATLVFAFVGMETRELVVTENNLQPANAKGRKTIKKKKQKDYKVLPVLQSLYRDTVLQEEPGVSTLTDETPSYRNRSKLDPSAIRRIKKRGNYYVIKSDTDPMKRTGFGLQFTAVVGIDQINQLPSFQNQYAQGQPVGGNLQWQGADVQEIFSWGPLVRTLGFDGSDYPYDKNGRLVPLTTGEAAKNYDPLSFFRTGFTAVNELIVKLPGPKNGTFVFDLENRYRSGIIPNSYYRKINFSASLKNYKWSDNLDASASVFFNQSNGDLLNRGANLASIVGSVYRTPNTFDNTNGLSVKNALNSTRSYELDDGTVRSHAPGLVDNPFGLVNELPDRDELKRFMGHLNLRYLAVDRLTFTLNGSIDRQWAENNFGLPVGYSGYLRGRLTQRKDNQTFANVVITPTYKYNLYNSELELSLSYQAQRSERQLDRNDGFNFTNGSFGGSDLADSIIVLGRDLSRTSHEIVLNAKYEHNRWLSISFTNRNYFSNTVNPKQYTNVFPSGSLKMDFARLFDLWPFDKLRLHVLSSRSIREAPLIYSNWSHESTRTSIEDYASFYESSELFFSSSLAPETERKFETGLKLLAFSGFSLNLVYFNNRTADFIAPVWNLDQFELQNAATVNNRGIAISTGYQGYIPEGTWGTDLTWSTYRSTVREVYGPQNRIPLAGFGPTQTVLAPGQPFGAIYGSSYQRNDAGQVIIDDDGFPLEDTNLKIIGNPIPDWTLGWSNFINWKRFRFFFLFDFRKGGEIWNGTNAALDYLGRSADTGKLRNTTNYVFEGADENGNQNTLPVNFADPSNPAIENRWARYGWDGVGEAYIEDASWVRLNEVVISYRTKRSTQRTIREMKFSLIGRNLLLVTPYTGVDPSANLFGYGTGSGLDLFNMPGTRSYSAQVTIKI